MKTNHYARLALFIALISTLLTGCGSVDQSLLTGNKRAYGYSLEQEIQIGQESDQAIIAEYGLYGDQRLSDYVTRVGQEVLKYSHAKRSDAPAEWQQMKFYFRVLDSPVVNAFALPGGYVYVTRGLLAHLDNEAQLAVVLGHEITHIVGRHASVQAMDQMKLQGGLLGGIVLGSVLGVDPNLMGTAADLASQGLGLLQLRYGRDAERESDQFGVEYAAMAGYKVGEAGDFFQSLKRMSTAGGQSIPAFLSTHPDPADREQKMQEYANYWGQQYSLTKVNQQELFGNINGMVVGEDPQQGFVENNMFYHPELRFQFPTLGWYVQNGSAAVQMMDPQQKAAMQFTLAQGSSAQAAASTFASQQGIQVIQSGATKVNGMNAYAVEAQATTQQNQTFRILTVFIEDSGRVYQFMGYTDVNSYNAYANSFSGIIGGFGRLTDSSKINRQATHLDIRTANRTAAFQAFVPSPLMNGLTPEGLAIINQVGLSQSISSGTPLKLVR